MDNNNKTNKKYFKFFKKFKFIKFKLSRSYKYFCLKWKRFEKYV